jgi:hypothetical protein
MNVRRLVVFLAVACFVPAAFADEAGTAAQLERVRNSPLELRRFVEALPKGGDLHNHLSGATYAESFMAWAAADRLCVDTTTYAVVNPCESSTSRALVSANAVLNDSTLYQKVLDTMSMRQFRPVNESGHDHFFRTFGAFGAVSGPHTADMLKEVVTRFADENVDYVETILSPDRGAAAQLGRQLPPGLSFADMRDSLLRGGMAAVVAAARKTLDDAEAKLGAVKCSTPEQQGCSVVRYISEVHRSNPREPVFAEMVFGFELATADPRVVAVNPVAPEDGYVSMRDFDEQMKMFAFLRPLYPNVALTTHAGELVAGIVPPEGLKFHIRDSIAVAGAQRIGHGVDIMRETDADNTMRFMASKPIAVEICLTSNDLILGVSGKDHPMRTYLQHGVPLVLATDDPGVSRGDLSTEFQRAVEEQGMSYKELKQFVRNSVQWSFLQGSSVWSDRAYTGFVAQCAHDAPGQSPSAACHAYLLQNPKAMRQWRLEERLHDFEQRFPQ